MILILRSIIKEFGFDKIYEVNKIQHVSCGLARPAISNYIALLVAKNLFVYSPDFSKVKLTEDGIKFIDELMDSEKEWEKRLIIRGPILNYDNLIIRSGELFRANRILRDILYFAEIDLKIIDPYFGSEILDIIEDSGPNRTISIIFSNRVTASTKNTCYLFSSQYDNTKFRILNNQIHDRFIICDNKIGFHLGHSLKDLGKKDCQINIDKNTENLLKLFDKRWHQGTTL
ncbi:MAG: hypothetical protein ACOYT8_00850 [Candidatus Dependentiae bacterium]